MINNVVVEALTKEHGKEIIDTFKSLGFDTGNLFGDSCKESYCSFRFYGVIDDKFDNYEYVQLRSDAKILTLGELKSLKESNNYPKVMLVSDDEIEWRKRVVFMEKNGVFLAWANAQTLEGAERKTDATCWKYAKDLPSTVEMTIEEVESELGIEHGYLKIVGIKME